MKLIILRNNLLEALAAIERAVGTNVNLPILKNTLLKAHEGKISLTATDLEFAVTHFVSGKIIESGETAIPFSIFSNVVRNLTSERITLERKDRKVLITTDNYEAVIEAQEPKEFPIIPALRSKKENLLIKNTHLAEALGSVIIATQYSDIRPEISGVYLEHGGEKFVLVATDSFRLAERTVDPPLFQSAADGISVIIPLKTAEELLRIFGNKDEEDVKLYFDQNQLFAVTESTFLTSRLIDGKFPDYRAVLPKEAHHEVEINRQELINAVKLTSSFSGRTNDVTLHVGDNKKFLEIYSASSTVGENRYRVPVKAKGEKLSVVFNWRYLLDGLKVFKSDEVTIGVVAADRPVSITSPHEPFLIYILMPIKM